MYDICGKRTDGKVLNCPFGSPAVKPDELLSSKIQSLCPTITGNVCCTEAQFDTLRTQVQQAIPFLVGCPACLRNFLNLFCELTCSPDQSLFINVTSVSKVNSNLTVDGIDFCITDAFGEGLYDSCKDVKFGTMNSRALEFIGAGAQNFKEWFAFIGRRAGLNVPGSPYAIGFRSDAPALSGMKPMNVSTYSCGDISLGCSCGDCPSSPVCSNTAPPGSHRMGSCLVRIGSLKAKCIDFALAILYIILVSVFLGWGIFHRTREQSPHSRTKPLGNVMGGGHLHSVNSQKDENLPMQMLEDAPQIRTGVRLSVVQGYMSNFFRRYGTWVARHPTLVLCSSLSIVLLLCLGLIRFKVETRPEKSYLCDIRALLEFIHEVTRILLDKLWVGPGSRAAEEKQFFDSHLAPFYRIEQLILATIPDAMDGKLPNIVTENNIKLLFEIQKKVDGIHANHSGSTISLHDICMKPLDQDCATQSVLQYFKMDPENYDNYGGVEHLEYCFENKTIGERHDISILSTVKRMRTCPCRRYGTWVARHPTLVLCSSLSIVLLLCLGLIRFKVETRPEKSYLCDIRALLEFIHEVTRILLDKLWVGPGSRAAEEKQFFDSHLAPFYRIEQLILATIPDAMDGKLPNIVTENNIKLLFEIQKKVDGIHANHSGSTISLHDICMKPLDQDCATQSVLQYFKMDPENYDNYGGVEHLEYCFEHYSSAETCMSAFKGPLDPSTALGGFPANNYSEASAFIITYPVNNAIDKEGNETQRAVAWEKAFIQLVKDELLPMVESKNLTLSFSSESSIEEELKRESTADAITIVISYLVMFAYISLTLGDAPRLSSFYISSKVLLGLSGVILVMLSVLGSVGFFSAIGVKSTLIIMEVIPFLVLAVGVDNMCILVQAVKRQPLELPLEGRISNALVEVGPSITLASLSEVLAFAVGSFIPMPACRVFSMFAALAVLLDFLLQVTAFVAFIVFDFLRAEDKRVDCFPCIQVSSSDADSEKGIGQRKPGLLVRYMKVTDIANLSVLCSSCILTIPSNPLPTLVVVDVHAPLLSLWGVKIVVISVFLGCALASIALCTRIEPGLEQKIVLPRDSYLQGYFNNVSEYLRIGPPLYFVVKNYNYSSESSHTNQLCSISQCDSESLLNEIARASLMPESTYIAKPAASWLDDFLVWMSPEAFGCCRKFTNGSYCPPDDQAPCCSSNDGPCGLDGVCKDCTTCFRHSDLHNDRPSTMQFREKLPWFLNALPSADCAKGGHGAYTSSVELKGYENGVIQASSFRTYHTPLNKQIDYVNSMRAGRDFASKVSDSLKIEIFPYSVFYMFFEQYLDIWRTALINLAIAIGAVFIVCLISTCSFWSSAIIFLVLAMIVVDLMGVMAILHIQLNAVSVVNLIMSVGIAVEFCVHMTHAFSVSSGDKEQRMKEALGTMGASVFSGITLTKLVGVIVLCFSRTEVFVVYYFQMYLALVLLGFLHGLVFLPVFLSIFGPPSRCVLVEQLEDQQSASSEQ
ncbi:Niemann-Pick C1 protein [Morella rubra]|uniref:Niemann-Pick C1 protein n=1 Tax=Morella rubra TaxID=262757 RepID=A0A6A1UTT7_9ROSI|nr:Niemann-Pick C1 protein [Morella rubra]